MVLRSQVAKAAITAGVGWAVLNRDAAYISELRPGAKAPIFCVSNDHIEIGRIQGRQFAALLPKGGNVLYIQGPSENSAAKERTQGMLSTKPANIQVTNLKHSGPKALRSVAPGSASLPRKSHHRPDRRSGFHGRWRPQSPEIVNESERERWLKLPFTGCDGLPKTGQAWVRSGILTATVFAPANAGQAIDMLFAALSKGQEQPERALTAPSSVPPLAALKPKLS